ncbi:MAG: hypothetical protein DME64_00130 [Verrucomicrobia bacterium]|nr:MAG: hypothetical protein DME64_00130 [Verrucomicrobiota bacterium]
MAGPGERLEFQSFLENSGTQRPPCAFQTFRVARPSGLILLPKYFYGSRSAKFHHFVELPACSCISITLPNVIAGNLLGEVPLIAPRPNDTFLGEAASTVHR